MDQAINHITVVGSGTMGHSIAQEFARAGFQVCLYDLTDEILQKALGRIKRNFEEMLEWKLITEDEIVSAMNRIETSTSLRKATHQADLVVEAVFEKLELKQEVFRNLDEVCQTHCILASNTSSLMPSTLAAVTRRPEQVLVLHYFFPPHLMPLVEIVRGEKTNDESVQRVFQAVIKAGKKPIIAQKEALGFIANRLQSALLREALYIIEHGIASPQDIDNAVKYSFGRRLAHVGPIELSEVQDGWEVMVQIEKYILSDLDHSAEPNPIIVEKANKGELGPLTGKGFYEWPAGRVERFLHDLYAKLAEYMAADISKQTR